LTATRTTKTATVILLLVVVGAVGPACTTTTGTADAPTSTGNRERGDAANDGEIRRDGRQVLLNGLPGRPPVFDP